MSFNSLPRDIRMIMLTYTLNPGDNLISLLPIFVTKQEYPGAREYLTKIIDSCLDTINQKILLDLRAEIDY